MEKAKAIREKRDLAKELGKWHFMLSPILVSYLDKWYCLVSCILSPTEDVRAFEPSAGQSSRPSRTKSNAGKQTTESESEDHNAIESEHSGDNSPNRRVRNYSFTPSSYFYVANSLRQLRMLLVGVSWLS